MFARHHAVFEAIREDVIDQLTGAAGGDEGAGTNARDAGMGAAPDRDARGLAPHRAHLGGVVARLQRFVETGDLERYREFLQRWVVVRLGEGGSPESILHAVAAIGDTVERIARERLGARAELGPFARDVARASYWATRVTVEVLAGELAQREREHRALVEAGGG